MLRNYFNIIFKYNMAINNYKMFKLIFYPGNPLLYSCDVHVLPLIKFIITCIQVFSTLFI